MKKIFTLLTAILLSASMVTQAQKINASSVTRDTDNSSVEEVLENTIQSYSLLKGALITPQSITNHKIKGLSLRGNNGNHIRKSPTATQSYEWDCEFRYDGNDVISSSVFNDNTGCAADFNPTGSSFIKFIFQSTRAGKAAMLFFYPKQDGSTLRYYNSVRGPIPNTYSTNTPYTKNYGCGGGTYKFWTGCSVNTFMGYAYYSSWDWLFFASSHVGSWDGSNYEAEWAHNDATVEVAEGHNGDMFLELTCGTDVHYVVGERKYTYNINVATNNASLGTVSKNKSSVTEGGSVTLTATETSGTFQGWSLDGGTTIIAGTNNQLTYSPTLGADAGSDGQTFTYTAVFVPKTAPQYTITTAVSPSNTYGTVTGAGSYYENNPATLTATSANEHLYIFDHWLKDGNNYAGGTTITPTVTANATYTAVFRAAAAGTITTAVNNASYGTASVSLTGSQPGGTAVTLTATPYGGYAFAGWDDNNDGTVDNTDNPRTVYVDGDKEYVAKFIVETASYASFSFDNPNDDIQIGKITQPSSMCQTEFYPYGISLVEIIAKNTTRTSKNYLQMYVKTNNFRTYNPVSGGSYYGPAYGTYSVSVPSEYGPVIGNCDNSIYESNYYFVYTGDATDVVIGYKVETASHGGTCHFQGYEGTLSQRLCVYSSYGADYSNETRSNFATFNNGTITVAEGAGGHPYITIRIGGTLVASIGAPAQPYTLAWDANGGELSGSYTAAGSVNEGASITAPTATRTGYTFTGWSPAFTGTMPSYDVTYTAQWTANTHTLTWTTDGNPLTGTYTSGTVAYGTTIVAPAPPTKNATAQYTYTFKGWSPAVDATMPDNDVTYTATWTETPVNYTLTWTTDGDELTGEYTHGTVAYGTTIVAPATPTKTGYTFANWSPAFTSTMPAANTEYVAQWNANTYTVSFNKNNESATGFMDTQAFTYGTAQNLTTNGFTLSGHDFAGWATEKNGAVVYTNGEEVTNLTAVHEGTVTLYAKWIEAFALIDDKDAGNSYYDETLAGKVGQTLSVHYIREFPKKQWAAFSLPFGYSYQKKGNNTFKDQVYYLISAEYEVEGGKAYLTLNCMPNTLGIEANKPYVLIPNDTIKNPVFNNVKMKAQALNYYSVPCTNIGVDDPVETVEFRNTLTRMQFANNDHRQIYLVGSKLRYPNNGTSIRAFRGYFYMQEGTIQHIQPRLRNAETGEIIEAEEETNTTVETKKYIENGILVIERAGMKYDAQGHIIK